MKSFDITLSENQETPTKEQVLKRLKELMLEKINAICKEKIIKEFKSEVLGSLHANEQEVTATLNANTENIKSEIKKLENQLIEEARMLLKQETQKSVKAYNAMMGHQPQNSLKHGLKNFNNPLSKEG
ncbi:hypothetical protein HpDR76_04020 [Helicobacter pylori]|uniref:hypothetical protein n=1 Tax=Helicobacter pylori TaxID=210 RepID=UPI00165C6AAD|nr:hypothetical protein [Helicobacter pylori]